jgi:hypothetical protein
MVGKYVDSGIGAEEKIYAMEAALEAKPSPVQNACDVCSLSLRSGDRWPRK